MVGKVTFHIRGAKEMEQLLKGLGPKIANRLGDKALRAGAKPIVKEAKRLVPRRTGELRKSITAIIAKPERNNERVAKIGFKPPASARAHFIEYGTSRNSAQPFMRPAMDSQAGAALQAMADSLASGILRQEWKNALGLLAAGTELDFGDE